MRFETLFETAERVRRGELGATAAHRDAIARLRAQAAQILGEAEHAATEATLRRVTQTLSALAAAGDWAPDAPGALSTDRDPAGVRGDRDQQRHSVSGTAAAAPEVASSGHRHAGEAEAGEAAESGAAERPRRDADEPRRRREREAAAARAEAAAELRRAEAERARPAAAERHRLEAALRTARGDIAQREREVVKLERDLAYARTMVDQARDVVAGLEERLGQLDN